MRAKEAGKAAVCVSQMKEIGSAARMYCDDWSDCLPMHFSYYTKVDETDPRRQHISYYDVLPRYLKKHWGSFVCPADPTGCVAWEQWWLAQPPLSLVPNNPRYWAGITGYATQLYPLNAAERDPAKWVFWKVGEAIRQPSQVAYMWEGYHDFVDRGVYRQLLPGTYKYDDKQRVSTRHNDGMNALYFDWHVKWLRHEKINARWLGWD